MGKDTMIKMTSVVPDDFSDCTVRCAPAAPVRPPVRKSRGPQFVDVQSMSTKERCLYHSLTKFYSDTSLIDDVIKPLIDKSSKYGVSIRLLNWFVTNYHTMHKVAYLVNGRVFDLSSAYMSQLTTYQKKLFDPFRRHRRILWPNGSGHFVTTLSQLNFFRWAIVHGVIEYVCEHKEHIEQCMKNDPVQKQRRRKFVCKPASVFFVKNQITVNKF